MLCYSHKCIRIVNYLCKYFFKQRHFEPPGAFVSATFRVNFVLYFHQDIPCKDVEVSVDIIRTRTPAICQTYVRMGGHVVDVPTQRIQTTNLAFVWQGKASREFSLNMAYTHCRPTHSTMRKKHRTIIPTQCFYHFFGDFDWSIGKIKLFLHFNNNPCVWIFDICLDFTKLITNCT